MKVQTMESPQAAMKTDRKAKQEDKRGSKSRRTEKELKETSKKKNMNPPAKPS